MQCKREIEDLESSITEGLSDALPDEEERERRPDQKARYFHRRGCFDGQRIEDREEKQTSGEREDTKQEHVRGSVLGFRLTQSVGRIGARRVGFRAS